MTVVICIFALFAFSKTIGYAIYEYQDKQNVVGAYILGISAFIRISSVLF